VCPVTPWRAATEEGGLSRGGDEVGKQGHCGEQRKRASLIWTDDAAVTRRIEEQTGDMERKLGHGDDGKGYREVNSAVQFYRLGGVRYGLGCGPTVEPVALSKMATYAESWGNTRSVSVFFWNYRRLRRRPE